MEQEMTSAPAWSHMLVESTILDDLLLPVKRSARLKYTCLSVSKKYIALGSNTGGVYIFSRDNLKHLQLVFGEKETSPVTMVQLSPNDNLVAFSVSSGSVYVIELNLERMKKPDQLCQTSDHAGNAVTALKWDGVNRIYVGDSSGKVSVVFVSTFKAKKLFTAPSEVILKLESAVVQIDSTGDIVLVSTLTHCYICYTNRQQFTQIGKKRRDGKFGACFYSPNKLPSSVVYCARPGSRIWEADCEGNVLNTHQFKQLLAIPPLPVLRLHSTEEYSLPSEESQRKPLSVNFHKLITLRDQFLLCWTDSTLFIIDPVNVKVILWVDAFPGLQDICCHGNEIYIFQSDMQIHCVEFFESARVISNCVLKEKWTLAGKLCCFFFSALSKKDSLRILPLSSIQKIHNQISETDVELGELLHNAIHMIKSKMTDNSGTESSDSSRSRSDSNSSLQNAHPIRVTTGQSISEIKAEIETTQEKQLQQNDKLTDDPVKVRQINSTVISAEKEEDFNNFGQSNIDRNSGDDFHEQITNNEEQGLVNVKSRVSPSEELMLVPTKPSDHEAEESNKIQNGSSYFQADGSMSSHLESDKKNIVQTVHITAVKNKVVNTVSLVLEDEVNSELLNKENGRVESDLSITPTAIISDVSTKNASFYIEDEEETIGKSDSASVSAAVSQNDKQVFQLAENTHIISQHEKFDLTHKENDLTPISTECLQEKVKTEIEELLEHRTQSLFDDDAGCFPSTNLGSRRASVTSTSSLSSISSNEVNFDPTSTSASNQISEPIRVKLKGKKTRKVDSKGKPRKKDLSGRSLGNTFSTGSLEDHLPKHTGSIPSFPHQEPIQKLHDSHPMPSFMAELVETHKQPEKRPVSSPGNSRVNRSFSTSQVNSLDKQSHSYVSSRDFLTKSADYETELEKSSAESPLVESWESAKSDSAVISINKSKLLKIRDRVTSKTKQIVNTIWTSVDETVFPKPSETFLPKKLPNVAGGAETITEQKQFSVDISELEECTVATRKKLHDLSIFLDQSSVSKILLDWVTVLNKTYQCLHLRRKEQTKTNPSEVQYNIESGYSNIPALNRHSSSDFAERSQGSLAGNDNFDKLGNYGSAKTEEVKTRMERVQNFFPETQYAMYSGSSSRNAVHSGMVNEFYYTKDPLFLPQHLLISVSELASVCFDIGCHGNIMEYLDKGIVPDYKDAYHCETESTLVSDALTTLCCHGKQNLQNEKSANCTAVCNICKECVCKAVDESDLKSNESGDLSVRSAPEIVQALSAESKVIKTLHDKTRVENYNGNHNCINSSNIHLTFDTVETMSDSVEEKTSTVMDKNYDTEIEVTGECYNDENVPDLGNQESETLQGGSKILSKNLEVNDYDPETQDRQLSYFVGCYFPYLKVSRIRKVILASEIPLYLTWCSLMTCIKEKLEEIGVEEKTILSAISDPLKPHSPDSQISIYILGYINRLFASNPARAVELCSKEPSSVSPRDVLYLCQLYSKLDTEFLHQYMLHRLKQRTSTHIRSEVVLQVCEHPTVRNRWFEILLSSTELPQHILWDDKRIPSAFSHKITWKHQDLLESILEQYGTNNQEQLLKSCHKYGYWRGSLRLLKQEGCLKEMFTLILHLADIQLLSIDSDIGLIPRSTEEWLEILQLFSELNESKLPERNAGNELLKTYLSDQITWENLGFLLIRQLGSSLAVDLLQKFDVPQLALTTRFYRACILAELVQTQQRQVLHSLLEKIDTYLWARKSAILSPKLMYAVTKEKQQKGKADIDKEQTDALQNLFSDLKNQKEQLPWQVAEDPDCHWGVNAKINSTCPCCGIHLKESVSHTEPGDIIFPCGHAFHRFCVPEKDCLLCFVSSLEEENKQDWSYV